jgi:hypothetical protein
MLSRRATRDQRIRPNGDFDRTEFELITSIPVLPQIETANKYFAAIDSNKTDPRWLKYIHWRVNTNTRKILKSQSSLRFNHLLCPPWDGDSVGFFKGPLQRDLILNEE